MALGARAASRTPLRSAHDLRNRASAIRWSTLKPLTKQSPTDRNAATTWVIVASRDHARRSLSAGFVMANHGKRAPLMSCTWGTAS